MRSLAALVPLVALGVLPGACRAPGASPAEADEPARALDWTLGTWEGWRRDGEDGSRAPMTMRVASILDGAGQTRQLEITHGGGVYRGFCVQVFDPASGTWHRRYVNDVRRRFAELEGTVEDGRSIWRGVSPDRTRESMVVSERPAADRWTRTMKVSEDGGETWRVLWVDELVRRAPR